MAANLILLIAIFVGLSLAETQSPSEWGLARVSTLTSDWVGPNGAPFTYRYDSTVVQKNVTVYIIDTGITPTHQDFGGRAKLGKNFVTGESNCDQNGHGTHVAGTIGGKQYGICKTCNLVGVKVLNAMGMGSLSAVAQGIIWAANDCVNGSLCVINMSLGGGQDDTIDEAVQYAESKRIAVIVAAGNSAADACTGSPSGSPGVLSVAASNISDYFASFSNHGRCIHVIAPGVNIKSTWMNSVPYLSCLLGTTGTATNTISGTSMASPHVAGLAAYLRTLGVGGVTAKETYAAIAQLAQLGSIKLVPDETINALAYNGFPES